MRISIKDKDLINQELKRMAAKLMELGCDSVQIITTNLDNEGTGMNTIGAGNFYARRASTERWLRCDQNDDLANTIAESLEEKDGF